MSYLDVNRFIDDQVKLLNKPLILNDEALEVCRQYGISDSQVRSILFKCNLQIKRQIRANYERPLIHEVIENILLSEKKSSDDYKMAGSKLEQLLSLEADESLVSGWALSNKVRRVNDRAECMPDGKYIILGDKDDNKMEIGSGETSTQTYNTADSTIPQGSHSETILSLKREEVDQEGTSDQKELHKDDLSEDTIVFRERYNKLRAEILSQHSKLLYQALKLEYLQNLRQKVVRGSQGEDLKASKRQRRSADLLKEMERFEILVEKLDKDEDYQ